MTDLVALKEAVDDLTAEATGLIGENETLQDNLTAQINALVLAPFLSMASSMIRLQTKVATRGVL